MKINVRGDQQIQGAITGKPEVSISNF
jgi:hypothetical protein